MNTKAVSATKPILHLEHPLAMKNTSQKNVTNISFNSQIAKSRISIANQTGRCRTRVKAQIQALYAPTETLYDLLGITEAVDPSDIKKAYKQMARKYHPDVSPPDRVDEYTDRFIMVHEAYETLSNPQTRALYDKDLAVVGFDFGEKTTRNRYCDQGMGEETEEWRTRWESQLDDLNRVNLNKGNMSWAARIRKQRRNR